MTKKIAIITQDPLMGGGVLRSLKVLHSWLENRGNVTIFFYDFSRGLGTSFRKLKFSNQILKFKIEGMSAVAIGPRFGFWEPSLALLTLPIWEKELSDFDEFWVCSGSALVAHPLALLKKKYFLWIATTFWDDRLHRINSQSRILKMYELLKKPFLEKAERMILQSAAKVFVISEYAKKLCSKLIPEEKIEICHFPLDISDEPDKLLKTENKYGKKILFSIARFSDPRKNLNLILDAFKIVSEMDFEVVLLLAGETTAKQKIKISKMKRVFLLGQIDDDEKKLLQKNATLFLISSWQEGLCIAGLEALQAGTPVLSTNCGGVTDFVIDNQTGWLVEPGNVVEFANKIIEVISAPELLQKAGEAGKNLLTQNFSCKKIYQTWLSAVIINANDSLDEKSLCAKH